MQQTTQGQSHAKIQREIMLEDIPGIIWRWKTRVFGVFLIVTAFSAAWYIFGPKHWRSTTVLAFIQREPASYSADQSYSAPIIETVDTQQSMLLSPEMTERALNYLQEDAAHRGLPPSYITNDPMLNPTRLQKDLSVTNPKDTNLIELSVDAHKSEDAVRYSNAFAQAFVAWKQELAQEDASEAIKNLKLQSADDLSALTQAEQELKEYQQHASILDADSTTHSAQNMVDQMSLSVAQFQSLATSATARRDNLASQLTAVNAAIKSSGTVRDDSVTSALETQLHQLQTERSAAAQKYTAKYPGVLSGYDAQIASVTKRLSLEISRTIDKSNPSLAQQADILQRYEVAVADATYANAQLASAIQSLSGAKAAYSAVPASTLGLQRLQRNVDLAKASYIAVQNQLTDAMLSLSNVASNVTVVQAAITPTEPDSPKLMISLIVIPLLGLIIGIVIAVRTENSSNRIRSLDDIHSLSIGPIIGALPIKAFNKQFNLISSVQPSLVSEAFSIARINLNSYLKIIDSKLGSGQTVLVTSATNGEGKSITAAELSLSYVRAGKTVTLIDANLRSPTINELMELESFPGLTDVLAGKSLLENVLVTSSEMSNFSIITSGSPVESPADSISSPGLMHVLNELKHDSDIVIIDCSSCETADPLALASIVDCVILVVDFTKSEYDVLAQAAASISSHGASRIAIMANNYYSKQGKAFQFGAGHFGPDSRISSVTNGVERLNQSKNGTALIEPVATTLGHPQTIDSLHNHFTYSKGEAQERNNAQIIDQNEPNLKQEHSS